jgi:DNA (cytosine-5)-methyltransferase 1
LHAFLDLRESRAQVPAAGQEDAELVPHSQTEAANHLQQVARFDRRQLRVCEKPVFLRGWFALFYLFPGLHPDNALDHGNSIEVWSAEQPALPSLEEFVGRRFARSGWPVALELLGQEAWRRYESGELSQDEFYCLIAQRAALHHRDNRAGPQGFTRCRQHSVA